VNRFASAKRYCDGMQRMIGWLDPERADEMRRYVRATLKPEAIAGNDMENIKEVADYVYKVAHGKLDKEAKAAHAEAFKADVKLKCVQGIKYGCDVGMFIGLFGVGHMPMVAYQGALGFVEGPPPPPPGDSKRPPPPTDPDLGRRIVEGAKRAAMWYNTATYVAAETFEGYHKGGYLGGEKGGWGALERGCEAFLMVKVCEWGFGKLLGVPPKAAGGKPKPKLPSRKVREAFARAEYQQKLADGLSLVDDYARFHAEYQGGVAKFGKASAEVAAMEKELQRKAASLHNCMESKIHLKEMYKKGTNVEMVDDFLLRMRQNHAGADARFRELLETKYGYQGVDKWKFKEFRNSANVGTPGMDHDFGFVEESVGQIVKKGNPVSRQTLHADSNRAWAEAYHAQTGYSGRTSFENLTGSTSVDAYKDLAWIGTKDVKHALVHEIKADWAGQAADVTMVKSFEMLHDPALKPVQGMAEAGRGIAKDIQTKLMPVLEQAGKDFPKNSARILERRMYWATVQRVLENSARDPVTANRQLRMMTGHDLPEVARNFRDTMANYGKAVGK
jgi:hypothetical protein